MDRQVISQMPSLVIAQVGSWLWNLVVTDSCGDLRFVLRELAYCIEDDRGLFNQPVDEPSSLYSKYCEQSLSNVWVVLLSPGMSGWNLTDDSVEQRTWWWLQWSRLSGTVHYWFKSCPQWDIICPVVCRFICEQPTKLLKYCKLGMELMRPFQNAGTCASGIRVWESEQENVLVFGFFGSYFIWNEISACIIDWRRAFEKLMAGSRT
jgi:hypothetical protein